MIINFGQTPSKFAPVSSRTLDIRENSHVAIVGIYQNRILIKYFLNQNLHSLLLACLGLLQQRHNK